MRRIISLLSFLLCYSFVSARESQSFNEDWLFALSDSSQMAKVDYNDSGWRQLTLPHDWSIEGDFLPSNPSGAGGGALPGGTAWYRKHFTINDNDNSSRYFIDFDGVYMNSTVYLNGHLIGNRPYGFSSFEYDITPYLNKGGENVMAVRVDNSDQPNCRWYSGCGIYRNVYLVKTEPLHVAHWGVGITSKVKGKDGLLTIAVNIANEMNVATKVDVRNSIIDMAGNVIGTKSATVNAAVGTTTEQQNIKLNNAHLWTIHNPYLYKVKTELIVKGKQVDVIISKVGVRTFKFDPQTGFSLNGVNMKINGVCMHHDLGCLGSAINNDALHRQLKMLQDMGCNAIRCSHNPPAPELLNMCDSMGFIVMDESFDMWRRRKTKNDYARFFDKWFERDLSDMVLRDRNHPCIMIWSIGNEVLEQWSSADADTLSLEQANMILNAGHDASTLAKGTTSVNSMLTKKLVDVVKGIDPTRPVTAGCNEPSPDNHLFKSGALDIIGFNYHRQWIKDVPKNFPNKPFMMTESVSALQTRGFYVMPSDSIMKAPKEWWLPYSDPSYMCSAYDNMHAPWSSTHEQTWDVVKHTPYCAGQFIWTGWDYIGEPTPYSYPAHSSYFGIIDLAGFPKDIYYMYQSEWTNKNVLHLFPHWNWIEGQTVDMVCYYNNADEVELFINGKSQGIRKKADSHQFHVMWRVTFEPGEVKAVARRNGKVVGTQVIKTAGAPDHIVISSDRSTMNADGNSMAFVTVNVVDKDGNLCPNADNQIFFDVKGEAKIAGVDNGSQATLERFKANNRKAFFGKCLVVLQSSKKAGTITLTAKGVDLKEATININNKER
jgi:beta-galactosidase